MLIIQPEDDKANDYFLVPDPDKPGYFRLVRIDNERAFFSPETIREGWFTSAELNVKSIIFCLEKMQISWGKLVEADARLNEYRRHIKQLVPAECFQTLLREASDLHDQWYLLFSATEVQHIAQAGLEKGEIIFPVMMILPDCEHALLERLYLIQQAWHSESNSGLSLLNWVQPNLYKYYYPYFDPKPTLYSVLQKDRGNFINLTNTANPAQHYLALSLYHVN